VKTTGSHLEQVELTARQSATPGKEILVIPDAPMPEAVSGESKDSKPSGKPDSVNSSLEQPEKVEGKGSSEKESKLPVPKRSGNSGKPSRDAVVGRQQAIEASCAAGARDGHKEYLEALRTEKELEAVEAEKEIVVWEYSCLDSFIGASFVWRRGVFAQLPPQGVKEDVLEFASYMYSLFGPSVAGAIREFVSMDELSALDFRLVDKFHHLTFEWPTNVVKLSSPLDIHKFDPSEYAKPAIVGISTFRTCLCYLLGVLMLLLGLYLKVYKYEEKVRDWLRLHLSPTYWSREYDQAAEEQYEYDLRAARMRKAGLDARGYIIDDQAYMKYRRIEEDSGGYYYDTGEHFPPIGDPPLDSDGMMPGHPWIPPLELSHYPRLWKWLISPLWRVLYHPLFFFLSLFSLPRVLMFVGRFLMSKLAGSPFRSEDSAQIITFLGPVVYRGATPMFKNVDRRSSAMKNVKIEWDPQFWIGKREVYSVEKADASWLRKALNVLIGDTKSLTKRVSYGLISMKLFLELLRFDNASVPLVEVCKKMHDRAEMCAAPVRIDAYATLCSSNLSQYPEVELAVHQGLVMPGHNVITETANYADVYTRVLDYATGRRVGFV